MYLAKAMESTWGPGAGAEGPPGVGDVERPEGCRRNWRGPTSALALRGPGASLAITGATREVPGSREGVGGGRISDDGRDNITRPERRAPTSSVQAKQRGTLMSAENSARSVRQADGLDPVRALQRVLYRSAKQDRTRRFHALYDKLARSDVMWRAWVDVATNKGAPGVDGVSIESVEDGGVESVKAFLDELAAQLRAGTYRPKPLRRVHIPKPGKPGQSRPLGIPALARPGRHDGGEDRARAYLRGRLPPGQLWVPAQALGPASPRSRPGGGQRGPVVGT